MARTGTVITYDVYNHHDAIKETLVNEGWSDTIDGQTSLGAAITCHLPNTTLWHKTKSAIEAREDFTRIAIAANIERFICYEFDMWAGFRGKRHKNDKK